MVSPQTGANILMKCVTCENLVLHLFWYIQKEKEKKVKEVFLIILL